MIISFAVNKIQLILSQLGKYNFYSCESLLPMEKTPIPNHAKKYK